MYSLHAEFDRVHEGYCSTLSPSCAFLPVLNGSKKFQILSEQAAIDAAPKFSKFPPPASANRYQHWKLSGEGGFGQFHKAIRSADERVRQKNLESSTPRLQHDMICMFFYTCRHSRSDQVPIHIVVFTTWWQRQRWRGAV